MNEKLEKLKRRYAERLPRYLDALAEEVARRDLEAVRERSHRVRGSAGSYGFAEVSRLMGKIEAEVRDAAAEGREPDWRRIAALLDEARVAAGAL